MPLLHSITANSACCDTPKVQSGLCNAWDGDSPAALTGVLGPKMAQTGRQGAHGGAKLYMLILGGLA